MMNKQKILIYDGPGAEATNILSSAVNEFIIQNSSLCCKGDVQYQVNYVTWKDFQTQSWSQNVKLLILPGGRDLPYVEKITDNSIKSIQNFIKDGGSFLGLCAGAYFACSYVEFEKDRSLEVCGTRKLSLFNGTGKGCVYPGFEYNSTSGSQMVPLGFLTHQNNADFSSKQCQLVDPTWIYYNGGGEFLPSDYFSDFEPVTYYKDFPEKLAIIYRSIGSGKVVLSFVHPEMSIRYSDKTRYTTEQWKDMEQYESQRKKLFEHLLTKLLM